MVKGKKQKKGVLTKIVKNKKPKSTITATKLKKLIKQFKIRDCQVNLVRLTASGIYIFRFRDDESIDVSNDVKRKNGKLIAYIFLFSF